MLHDQNFAPAPRGPSAPARSRPWLRLLSALLELGGGKAELVSHTERPWASATFCGSRHRVLLQFKGSDGFEAGDRFAECLGEHEFAIPGQIVADAAVIALDQTVLPEPCLTVEAEILLLEET